ncbi:MAG: HNH endonuclease domain-containing protein, partial [Melioribacter sp.]|nr:HNH endonuclease domain-containing protein [Melioribacter sp.]
KKILDIDETSLYINDELKERLFDLFNSKEEIKEKDILLVINEYHKDINPIQIGKKDEEHSHYINLFRTRTSLKGNETKHRYRKIFKELSFNGDYILNSNDLLMKLWHADYSNGNTDEKKSFKGILSILGWKSESEKSKNWGLFQLTFQDAISIANAIIKLPPYENAYGSYSALAIRKILILMRVGKYWKHPQYIINQIQNEIQSGRSNKERKEKEKFLQSLENALDTANKIYERLNSINYDERKIQDISDDEIPKQLLKSFIKKRSYEEFIKGLNTYQAGYLLYGKHSEQEIIQVNTPEEYSTFIQKILKPGSLRNPIVESVVRETCALVKDVWKKFGQIDEIHIELARELKHNTEERAHISKIQNENLEEKQRIKKILYELLNYESIEHFDENGNRIISGFTIRPNPENLEDIQRFRLWKEQASLSDIEWEEKIKEEEIPKQEQIKKYILWLSQNCRSPYTGKIIPISKLFDGNVYEVDHIIPRSKMKNDAMNNLVIVESGVNKAKGNELAANFIANRNGYCEYEGKKIDILK